jgi:hypothetical protein
MFPVFKSEVLHCREHWADYIEYLCHGRYLPVEVTAVNNDTKIIHGGLFMRIHLNANVLVRELEFGSLESEVICCAHKVQKVWDGKRELVEDLNLELLEARCRNSIKKFFQVSCNTFEPETAKIRKSDGCRDRRVRKSPSHLTTAVREMKADHEGLQLGHE